MMGNGFFVFWGFFALFTLLFMEGSGTWTCMWSQRQPAEFSSHLLAYGFRNQIQIIKALWAITRPRKLWWCLCLLACLPACLFGTGFFWVALAVWELAQYTRLASSSEIHLFLPPDTGFKGVHHHHHNFQATCFCFEPIRSPPSPHS